MVDQLVVVFYLIFLLIVGVYQKSKSYSLTGYSKVVGEIKNNRLLLMATIFSTAVGGGTIFGLSEKAFTDNLSYTYALIIAILSDILLAIFVVPRIALHHGAISIGDIMQKYYGSAGRFIVGLSAAVTSFGYIAAQISASGRIFEHILKINLTEGVILSYLICIIYTTTGGIRSVMFTNLVQFLVMMCTIPFISIVSINHIGFFQFLNSIPEYKYSLSANLEDSLWLALGFCLMGFYPSFIQRALITDKSKNTRDAILIKSFVYILFLGIISINGLVAFVTIPEVESILIVPELIHKFIPVGLRGVIVIGLLSAVMSTADTDLNIASISIVNDLMRPIFNISNQKILLLFSQITTVIVGTVTIYIALAFNNIVDLIIFVAGFWAPICFVPIIAALFNIVVSKKFFILSSSVGVISFGLWEYNLGFDFKVKGVFVGTFLNIICFLFGYVWNKNSKTL